MRVVSLVLVGDMIQHRNRLGGSNIAPILIPMLAEWDWSHDPRQGEVLKRIASKGVFGVTAKDVWEEVTGRREAQEKTPNMDRGTVLEPVIRKLYERATGRTVQARQTVYRDDNLTFSPDGVDSGGALVEFKTCGWTVVYNLGTKEKPDYYPVWREPGRIPPYYMLQVQWGMHVMGLSTCHVAGLFGQEAIVTGLLYALSETDRGGPWPAWWSEANRVLDRWTIEHLEDWLTRIGRDSRHGFRMFTVPYQDELGAWIEESLTAWWENHVILDVPP